ncbi:amidohydrolase [Aquimarina hainanensis]|uniref:Amidohydrolase n=1 Tax=Aquimarina hainanensis TaxID=1578017 RepID=A0ABW5N133_9FLAO
MNNILHLALFQSHLAWENPVQNRAVLGKKIHAVNEGIDIVVLPEMFTSGFTMNPYEVAEAPEGETIKWMKQLAGEKKIAICGSLTVIEEGAYYNRFVFVEPSGKMHTYNKRQLFTLAKEHQVYKAGSDQLVIMYKGWRIRPLICYDLRFPVWARNTQEYDVLLYVASWPKIRIEAWDALLKARAIENMSYCIGVNRVGLDGNGYEYNGHSRVFDMLGKELSDASLLEKESVIYTSLDKNHLDKTRKKFPFLEDADRFTIHL